ncbi:MAG: insulinase family protein, partial [Candidatus Competibacteraceae bacterium]|nr:insulinase family protein [Candidatus Competibacteraceae bacterium]
HILEHTALCGSERYPVRDPFFMMIRRSLNTFMNAFTSSDWTAYPFASLNRKDFFNLLDVYLDAAFFPLLDELDFAQEGHRVEFINEGDGNARLTYKGVVFNEMKGAMSSPISTLAQTLQSYLFPTTTYHHNSGGNPARIPDLTHEQLKQFHARHYHPSNALFMTYGDIPAGEHQLRFQERVLGQFRAQPLDFAVPGEQRYQTPLQVEDTYALEGEEDTAHKTHIVLGWLWGPNTDLLEVLRCQILADVLLDNSSSPLRQALETTELGTSPSPLCGFDDNTRETTFVAGLEGSDPEQAAGVEELVLGVIGRVAKEGVPREMLESVLHQLELSQREITGDGFPYGLKLMLDALTPALHGGDPAAALDLDPALAALRQEIDQPDFIQNLAQRLLLDNPHRVRLVMRPDPTLGPRQQAEEQRRLEAIQAAMTAGDIQRVNERARALELRQERQDDPELLPKVTLADVPAEMIIPRGKRQPVAELPAAWYEQGTNGMVYQQLILDLPALDAEELALLPLLTLCLTEVGSGGRDYLQTQALQAAVTGGLNARVLVRGGMEALEQSRGLLVVAGKALARHQAPLARLLRETLETARFDELSRIRELVAQLRAQREEGVSDHGHLLAMLAAGSSLNPLAGLGHRWEGLEGLRSLRTLDEALKDHQQLTALASRLEGLREKLAQAPLQLLQVAEAEMIPDLRATLEEIWAGRGPRRRVADFHLGAEPVAPRNQGWAINATVNFCAKAYPTVAPGHQDAPALTVLGEFLRNGYLHRTIREQGGAYGAGAGYQGDTGLFRFFSYRDPRLADTLADFDRAVSWLAEKDHPAHFLEEAILGVVGSIDRPGSPAGEAISAHLGSLFGRTPEQRQAYRRQVLEVSQGELLRVAEAYLRPEQAGVAVLGSGEKLRHQAQLGLKVESL